MPQELIPITYQDSKGQTHTTHMVRGRPLTRSVENFCRLVAAGEMSHIDAYCQVYDKVMTQETGTAIVASANYLLGRTDVVLRIQQLRTPVLPEISRKYTYNLNKAMDECQLAWDLAFAQGNVTQLIKLIELRSRLNKMLSEQIDVTHKHGFLDDAATQVLVDMKKQLEELRAKKKKAAVTVEAVEVE